MPLRNSFQTPVLQQLLCWLSMLKVCQQHTIQRKIFLYRGHCRLRHNRLPPMEFNFTHHLQGPPTSQSPPIFFDPENLPCPQQTYKRSALSRYCERHNPQQILTRFWSVTAQVLTNEAVVTNLRTGSALRIFSPPSSATDSVSPQESD